MTWSPMVPVEGDLSSVSVSASDVENESSCGQFLSLKVHRNASARGWRRLWPPRGTPNTFALKDIRDIVRMLGSPITLAPQEISTRIARGLDSARVLRQLRPWVEHAVWSLVEAIDSIESVSGQLHLIETDPAFGSQGRMLNVWADVYDADNGVRQVHRLRTKSAHPAAPIGVDRWSATAAWIAASLPGRPVPDRVQVVEIGLRDATTTVTFDGDVAAAQSAYVQFGQARASALCIGSNIEPCRSCGECKAAGVCTGLVSLDGFLGQKQRGVESRVVSPTDLRTYQTCPAQWMMKKAGVPTEDTGSPASDRGRAVHAWLRSAHARGVPCTMADLPAAGGSVTIGSVTLEAEDFVAARPYLIRHLESCPLAASPAPNIISLDESLRGYDHDAEVVVAFAPDLIYSDGRSLIVREVKTTTVAPGSADEAFDAHLQIPFAMRALASGLAAHHGYTHGVVELEVLTPDSAALWSWSIEDSDTMLIAESQLETVAEPWHNDTTWPAAPSPACDWCPVRRWCPDRDAWSNSVGAEPEPSAPAESPAPF